MITEAVLVSLVTAIGLILSGVLVELAKARRRQDAVVNAVTSDNGTPGMADAVKRIEIDVRELRVEQNRSGQRLAGLEAIVGLQTAGSARRNGRAG